MPDNALHDNDARESRLAEYESTASVRWIGTSAYDDRDVPSKTDLAAEER